MAQAIWQFVSNTGYKHKIGLYHGDSTGHLLIYCDNRIVKMDFSVKEPSDYAFFVDDEFCHVSLHQEKDGSFTYDFKIDKDVDTPLNQERKKEKRLNGRLIAAIVVGLIAIVGAFFYGMRQYQEYTGRRNSGWAGVVYFPSEDKAVALHQSGKKVIVEVSPDVVKKVLNYRFTTEAGQEVLGRIAWDEDETLFTLSNGFTADPGDTYSGRYDPQNPKRHFIDFLAPTPVLVDKLIERALASEARKHGDQVTKADLCLVQCVLEESGWESLQHVINQYVQSPVNGRHNADTYKRLLREPKFDKAYKDRCWDTGE